MMIGSRQKELLKEIVEEHIKTARPVGSKSLCKKFKCSSATIRNDMAILENLGYLEKTHISSGRIPSEEGYRYYVDNLLEPKKISGEDMLKLQTIFNNKELELSDITSIKLLEKQWFIKSKNFIIRNNSIIISIESSKSGLCLMIFIIEFNIAFPLKKPCLLYFF